jgi:type III pantothenate kinase
MSLLLAVDVGNTNVVMGIYDLSKGPRAPLAGSWRMATDRERTSDEYGLASLGMLAQRGIVPADIGQVIISSVVPPLHPVLDRWLRIYFHCDRMWVEPGIETGLAVLLDNPEELGADRIVNAVAGLELFGAPLVVVDFGTATTFDVVSANREYLGGIITPGIRISSEALFQRASRLPRVEIAEPARVVGKSTVQAMQSGLYYGYVGLVDGILARVLEAHPGSKVVATGGLANVISPASRFIQHIAMDLTLEGLRILWQMNQKP